MVQDCFTSTSSAEEPTPVDLAYTEPSGWTSTPTHCANRVVAERLRDATNFLTPAAATRRVWTIAPCACGGAR